MASKVQTQSEPQKSSDRPCALFFTQGTKTAREAPMSLFFPFLLLLLLMLQFSSAQEHFIIVTANKSLIYSLPHVIV